MNTGGAAGMSPNQQAALQQLQTKINQLMVQLILDGVRKDCFDRCFDKRNMDSFGKNEQICLAKCMDRLFESHSVVSKAAGEMAQNLAASGDM